MTGEITQVDYLVRNAAFFQKFLSFLLFLDTDIFRFLYRFFYFVVLKQIYEHIFCFFLYKIWINIFEIYERKNE